MMQHSLVPPDSTRASRQPGTPAPVSAPHSALARDLVLVLDFGGQTAQLIARRVREQNVFCPLVRHDLAVERIRELAPRGLILSGGPASVYEPRAPHPDPRIFDLGIPILGICYGMQVACLALGNEVSPGDNREFGRTTCRVLGESDLFRGVSSELCVWMSHGDQVKNLSSQWHALASTGDCPAAAVRHHSRPIFGLQFHPEVTHTQEGGKLLGNFVRNICGCEATWKMSSFIEQEVHAVRERVGDQRVICGLSGGVDSSVVAALLFRAIGRQLSCIFVDNGLLRLGENEAVRASFGEHFRTDLHVVDARERFLSELKGLVEPQQKRKAIGRVFIDVFRKEAESISGAKFLAQGTLYPDVIESGASVDGPAATIKHHHNVGGLPDELGFELIEPLRDLFKDEVRSLGVELGLPEEMIWRHPFPGPGLAVRCLGEVRPERLEVLRKADAIVLDELRKAGLYRKVQQAFAVLLPVQSVGVMGDFRTYDDVVAVRAVQTEDFMTADWYPLPSEVLQAISTRITNTVRGVSRVVYDISSKPPSTIEWE
ncbi:MAG TPA: glutamine-hydrolyzing GMP synthase [Planctomycetaceae bacterium]|nr:glutamine-hydrolyzing GMP synthase [Planctomycetaceae bacterium]